MKYVISQPLDKSGTLRKLIREEDDEAVILNEKIIDKYINNDKLAEHQMLLGGEVELLTQADFLVLPSGWFRNPHANLLKRYALNFGIKILYEDSSAENNHFFINDIGNY